MIVQLNFIIRVNMHQVSMTPSMIKYRRIPFVSVCSISGILKYTISYLAPEHGTVQVSSDLGVGGRHLVMSIYKLKASVTT